MPPNSSIKFGEVRYILVAGLEGLQDTVSGQVFLLKKHTMDS